jgi:hypothetical protein
MVNMAMNVKTIITRDNRDLIKNICMVPFCNMALKTPPLPLLNKGGIKGW